MVKAVCVLQSGEGVTGTIKLTQEDANAPTTIEVEVNGLTAGEFPRYSDFLVCLKLIFMFRKSRFSRSRLW